MESLNLAKIEKYNTVFFDFDMTLVNTKNLINQAILDLLQVHFPNKEWDFETIQIANNQSDLRIILKNLLSTQGITTSDEELEILRTHHKNILAKQDSTNSLAPDLKKFLKTLKSADKILVIITNNDVLNVTNLLGNLSTYFDFIVGVGYQFKDINLIPQNYNEYKKPSSKMLQIAYERVKKIIPNPKIIFVGDDNTDQKSVQNFNLTNTDQIKFLLYKPFS